MDTQIDLSKTVDNYMRDPASGLNTDSTRRTYESVLGRMVKSVSASTLDDVDPEQLNAFALDQGVAYTTRANRRSVICSFFRWCEAEGLLSGPNPSAKLARTKTTRKTVRKGRWLSAEELGRLLKAPDPHTPRGQRDRVIIALAMFTGMRCLEIYRLTWGDVDLSGRTLQVHGKGDKHDTLGMPDELLRVLEDWQGSQTREVGPLDHVVCQTHARCVPGAGFNEPSVATGTSVKNQTIWRAVRENAEKAGLGPVAPHDLRRSYAGLLRTKDTPLDTIQALLRHSNIGTTQTYLAGDPTARVEAGRAFSLT